MGNGTMVAIFGIVFVIFEGIFMLSIGCYCIAKNITIFDTLISFQVERA